MNDSNNNSEQPEESGSGDKGSIIDLTHAEVVQFLVFVKKFLEREWIKAERGDLVEWAKPLYIDFSCKTAVHFYQNLLNYMEDISNLSNKTTGYLMNCEEEDLLLIGSLIAIARKDNRECFQHLMTIPAVKEGFDIFMMDGEEPSSA